MNYSEAVEYLFSALPMFQRDGASAYKKDLSNTLLLCSHLGNPHKQFKSIHIAGTNGKGSTSHMLASILQEHGLKTGLYTSPHLKDFRERIRINGEMVSEEFVADFVYQNKDFFDSIKPSFFEITVAMAFAYFAKEQVDIAVIETGMGGRLDSTNVIQPELCIITNIGWDHMQFLGDTLPKIAAEKAGIIKHKVPVVISERQEEVQEVFMHKADREDAPCIFADDVYEVQDYYWIKENNKSYLQIKYLHWVTDETIEVTTDLLGKYQIKNVAGVLTAVDELEEHEILTINRKAVLNGLKNVQQNTGLQGRWQILGQNPTIIADTGHNKPGLLEILEQLKQYNYNNLRWVIGFVNDKDIHGMLEMLPKEAIYYFTKASIPRAMDEKLLAQKAAEVGLKGKTYSTPREALHQAKQDASPDDFILIGGSTFVVAEVL
ncbi:MAG: bifunctional folylpolyglutamate synthase/dihydrofolate synthase [Flavobacteriales bacterium]|nr:bifunctional folylpolyglutamate synthase/dihydrofolate synthase [Flavobacteriales bacterium]